MVRLQRAGADSLPRRFFLIVVWTAAYLSATAAADCSEGAPAPAAAKAKLDFEADVAPILRQHCVDCHGPVLQLGDLRLDQRQYAITEGLERDLIKPGHSDDSLLIGRLVDKKLGLIMPPSFPFFPEDKLG